MLKKYEMLKVDPIHWQVNFHYCRHHHPVNGTTTVHYKNLETILNEGWEPCGISTYFYDHNLRNTLLFKRRIQK